ncbi:MAG: fasciclin domain-containing protein [Paracoccaceae bacterium]|nr:fasciclin domain-containing protein [Loktanella sp.]
MKTSIFTAATVAATAAFGTMAHAEAHEMANPMVGGAEMSADMNIVENAVNSPINTTLVAAVQAADLVDTLAGEGPFTVFAPTDDAFAALDQDQLAALLEPENQAALQQILTCHVVAADAMSSDIVAMIQNDGGETMIETVGGCMLTASLDGDDVVVTDERGQVAQIEVADVDQSNGVIHVIDTVLLPAEG